MRVVFVLIAALVACDASFAAAPDSAGPPPSDAPQRHPYPQKKRVLPSPITDHFSLRGTFFAAALDTNVHVDAPGVPGTLVNAEHDLGMKGRLNQGRIELISRARERSRLRVDYFSSDRDGDRPIGRDILFAGNTFVAGDLVQSDLAYSMLGFTYTYSAIRTEHFELGAGLGVHLLQGDIRGTDVTNEEHAESSSVGAFPTPALDGTWAISQRFALTARAQYLHATLHGTSGSLGDYHTDLQYRWRTNFEVGLGYEEIRAQLETQHSNTPAGFALSVKGPELFLRVSF